MSSGISLTGDIAAIAATQEWGLLIACVVFCGIVVLAVLFGVGTLIKTIIKLFKQSLDTNEKLTLSIDNLSDNQQDLKQYLTNNTELVLGHLSKLDTVIEKNQNLLYEHDETLKTHNNKINGLEDTVYNHK